MKKIMELTEKQLIDFNDPNERINIVKNILGVKKKVFNVGTTTVKVNNSKPLDVFEDVFNDKENHYIIISVIDENLAMAYSIY